MFNKCVLSPFTPSHFLNQQKPSVPLPMEIDGEMEYEVEKILDCRK
jgi:hypothetical protein